MRNAIRHALRNDIYVVVVWVVLVPPYCIYLHWAALNLFPGELRTYLVARGHPDSLSSPAFGRWRTTSIRNSTNWEVLSAVILANVVCIYFLYPYLAILAPKKAPPPLVAVPEKASPSVVLVPKKAPPPLTTTTKWRVLVVQLANVAFRAGLSNARRLVMLERKKEIAILTLPS